MCCARVRIWGLVFVTSLSVLLHFLFPKVAVVFWYMILINISTFIVYSIYVYRQNRSKERLNSTNLYYFSAIGGIIGAFFGIIIYNAKEFNTTFFIIQVYILIVWTIALICMYYFYEPFYILIQGVS